MAHEYENESRHSRDLNERVASLETALVGQRDTISDISDTLKQVVETQRKLAIVSSDISRQSEMLSRLTEKVYEMDKGTVQMKYVVDRQSQTIEHLCESTEKNTRVLGYYKKIGGVFLGAITFLTPFALYIMDKFF